MFCKECGKQVSEGAAFCENCGAATAAGQGAARTTGGDSSNAPSPARGWLYALIPVALVLGLAIGFAIGFLVTRSPGGDTAAEATLTTAAQTTLATATITTALPPSTTMAPPTTAAPTTTTTFPPSTTTAPPTTAAPTTTSKSTTTTSWPDYVMEWPMDRSGWTVQVARYDGANPFSEGWAQDKAEEVLADDLPAGVLYSSDFNSLPEGFYVVFSGVFKTKAAAQAHKTKVTAAGYAGTSVVEVVP
jgi:hypothetical protein